MTVSRTLRAEVDGRPLTANRERKATPRQRARLVRELRTAWAEAWAAVLDPEAPHLRPPVTVTVVAEYGSRRNLPDAAGVAPAAKAAIDGLADAGGIPGDGPEFVSAITFCSPRVVPELGGADDGRMVIVIAEPEVTP